MSFVAVAEKAEHVADAFSTGTSLLGVLTYAWTGSTKDGAAASNFEGMASFTRALSKGTTDVASDYGAADSALSFATAVSPEVGGCH